MRRIVLFAVKYWIGWILFFALTRLAFLCFNFKEASLAGLQNFIGSMWHGARMDMSMAAYFTLPIMLLLLLAFFFKSFQKKSVYFSYTAIILLPVLILLFADMGLFKAWGNRVDDGFLKYLQNPREAWASVSHLPVVAVILFFVVIYAALLFVLKRWMNFIFPSFDMAPMWGAVVMLLMMGAFILPIRGGWQLAPLNQSSVYFSQNNFSNLAAINPIWNFLRSLTHHTDSKNNPYVVMPKNEAITIVDSLLRQLPLNDTGVASAKPNVILIIWESFTEKALHINKNGTDVAPGFEQLQREGIYFSNIYATGDRTDKGIVGILSGYPAQPTTSIVKIPSKATKLPMLPEAFRKQGYQTAFYYGGELEFANMKAYLMNSGFDHFTSISDFERKDQNSKWGAHDDVVMKKFVEDIDSAKQPFFYTWLTLSSHEPFETPVKTVIEGNDDESKFLNSLHYTDNVVFNFIAYCKQQPWWQNTIVAIVADHGHPLPNLGLRQQNFRIPMLLLGGTIKPSIITKTGSQNDLAAILSFKAGMPYQQFTWSKNLFDSTVKSWGYFAFNNGFGFVNDSGSYVFDNVGRRPIENRGGDTASLRRAGQALLQQSFGDYLKR